MELIIREWKKQLNKKTKIWFTTVCICYVYGVVCMVLMGIWGQTELASEVQPT